MECLDENRRKRHGAIGGCKCAKCCDRRKKQTIQARNRRHANPEKFNAKRRAWNVLNPERARKVNLRQKFGIEIEEYENMLSKQNFVCAICHKSCSTGRNLAVDHNHDTSKIRGLLCSNCNKGIGMFQDSIDLLRTAVAYLEENN